MYHYDAKMALEELQEDALLHIARRVIIKVVEPDFAPGNDLRLAHQPLQFVEVILLG